MKAAAEQKGGERDPEQSISVCWNERRLAIAQERRGINLDASGCSNGNQYFSY
jgi:hypothetical protein